MAAVCAAAGAAFGQVVETGDAGEFPAGGAFVTDGVGALTSISGSTGFGDLVDAYEIQITDADNFFATTDSGLGGDSSFDTRLWLFDTAGNLVLANDDTPATFISGTFQSFIGEEATYAAATGGIADVTAVGVELVNGQNYVVAISGFSNDPEDAFGNDLASLGADFDALFGPEPGVGPFAAWENSGFESTGSYTIALGGATFAIPTPGSAMALGLAGLVATRRRR